MKWIKYTQVDGERNIGTEEAPVLEKILSPVMLSYCAYNEEVAKREAHNGEYTIEDDGQPDPADTPSDKERLEALESAMLEMLGVSV